MVQGELYYCSTGAARSVAASISHAPLAQHSIAIIEYSLLTCVSPSLACSKYNFPFTFVSKLSSRHDPSPRLVVNAWLIPFSYHLSGLPCVLTRVGFCPRFNGSVLRDDAAKSYYHADLALERADEALYVCPHAGVGVVDVAWFWALRGCAEKKREGTRKRERGATLEGRKSEGWTWLLRWVHPLLPSPSLTPKAR